MWSAVAQLVERYCRLGIERLLVLDSTESLPLSRTLYPLLSTGSTQEDSNFSRHDWVPKSSTPTNSDFGAVLTHKAPPIICSS